MSKTFDAVNGTAGTATLTPISAALSIPDSLTRLKEEARQRVTSDRETKRQIVAGQLDEALKQLTHAIRSDLLHDLHGCVDWVRVVEKFDPEATEHIVNLDVPGHWTIFTRYRRAAGNWHRWCFHTGSTAMGYWQTERPNERPSHAHTLGEALCLAEKTPEEIAAETAPW